jgi:hypothetical protein
MRCRWEQVKEEQLHHRSASDRVELDRVDQRLGRREQIIPADCHWSISPAWCYAIALSRRSVERRLSSTAQLPNSLGVARSGQYIGKSRIIHRRII